MASSRVPPAASLSLPVRIIPLVFLVAALGILGGALVLQYGFDVLPCELCRDQRVAPGVVIALAALALWPWVPGRIARGLTVLIGLAFLSNAVLAGFHIGVEQHWWSGTDTCGGVDTRTTPLSGSLAELRAGLTGSEVVPCDTIAWSFLGVSLAGYNMGLSLVLAGVALWAVRRPGFWR